MNLLDARAKLAAALAPVDDRDPTVLVNLVDALEPPVLMLGWGEPWLTPDTACLGTGRLVVTCVAGRLVPGAGVETLETLVARTLYRLALDGGAWPLDTVSGPRVFTIGNVNYLAARLTLRVPISRSSAAPEPPPPQAEADVTVTGTATWNAAANLLQVFQPGDLIVPTPLETILSPSVNATLVGSYIVKQSFLDPGEMAVSTDLVSLHAVDREAVDHTAWFVSLAGQTVTITWNTP